MKRPKQASERLLNWAFVLALLVHAAALGGAACLPTQVGQQDLTDIRVFDTAAPGLITPVELVQLTREEPENRGVEESGVEIREPASADRTTRTLRHEENRATVRTDGLRRQQARQQEHGGASVLKQPRQRDPGSRPAATPGGGGGGGTVELGTPSSSGDPVGAADGGTPVGGIPGTGSGSGSGESEGNAGGSGGGSGGGTATGQGTGEGPGAGATAGGGEGDGGFVSRVADRDEPEVVYKGTLEYPRGAVEDGREGVVKLKVLVSERGMVAEVQVSESSGDRRLDAAATEFVKGWRYKPAVQDGKPRRVWTHAVVRFELR